MINLDVWNIKYISNTSSFLSELQLYDYFASKAPSTSQLGLGSVFSKSNLNMLSKNNWKLEQPRTVTHLTKKFVFCRQWRSVWLGKLRVQPITYGYRRAASKLTREIKSGRCWKSARCCFGWIYVHGSKW